MLPAFCSKTGAVASGTVFISKGLSEGSSVYWCRAFSIPGTETVKPAKQKHRQKNSVLIAGTVTRPTGTRILGSQLNSVNFGLPTAPKAERCQSLRNISVSRLPSSWDINKEDYLKSSSLYPVHWFRLQRKTPVKNLEFTAREIHFGLWLIKS